MAELRERVRKGIKVWARNLTEEQLAGISLTDLETDLMAELGRQPIEVVEMVPCRQCRGAQGLPCSNCLGSGEVRRG